MLTPVARQLPIGAEVGSDGVHLRVWAPNHRRVRAELWRAEGSARQTVDLQAEPGGYFGGFVPGAQAGWDYHFLLGHSGQPWADPASRFQPSGPLGPSRVIDPSQYPWDDREWPGIATHGHVIYEMHVGTFTPEGTWGAAARQLAELSDLGITLIELMPVAEFKGAFGWSYDNTHWYAPTHLYGTPDDFRAFVDEAHRVGIGVALDVVYNHFSQPAEQFVRAFAKGYTSRRYKSEWGYAVNFDDQGSPAVREFVLANVEMWMREYHLDGLRVDATQGFEDRSPEHILLEICRTARRAAGEREVIVIGENEPQRAELLCAGQEGGCEFDAMWNDDFHHAAQVRLTGKREGYYHDYRGAAEEFAAGARFGYLFQGQRYAWQDKPRGTPAFQIAPGRFINYLQNHDQIANSARGERLHSLTSPGRMRAMTALLLLGPQMPLLFQGQEFAASSPFLYFNDCEGDQAKNTSSGRAKFLTQFRSLATPQMQAQLPDACERETFERSKLDFGQREHHAAAYALHRDLLALRRSDQAIRDSGTERVETGTISPDAFILRYALHSPATRLLVVNFGPDLLLPSVSHPLAAPPRGLRWKILWSSDDPRYGGSGSYELDTVDGWRIPGEAAVLLHPAAP
jgi:maltooligosyltrehalose trehalohydrolase